jgi:hypothetical protein
MFVKQGAVEPDRQETGRVTKLFDTFKDASVFPMRFGASARADYTDLRAWVSGEPR